ncbi:MAG: hypothetical protein WA003_09360 [Desulfuromonadaceae bacterium]
MFQEKVPEQADKSGLDTKPPGTLKDKKRHPLGTGLGDGKKVWHDDTQITADTKNSMEFWCIELPSRKPMMAYVWR